MARGLKFHNILDKEGLHYVASTNVLNSTFVFAYAIKKETISNAEVEFPVHARSENTKSIMKKKSEKNNAKFKMLSFFQKIIILVSNIFIQLFKVSTL